MCSNVVMKRTLAVAFITFAGEMALRQESATALVPQLLPESYREGARPPLATEVFDDVRIMPTNFTLSLTPKPNKCVFFRKMSYLAIHSCFYLRRNPINISMKVKQKRFSYKPQAHTVASRVLLYPLTINITCNIGIRFYTDQTLLLLLSGWVRGCYRGATRVSEQNYVQRL